MTVWQGREPSRATVESMLGRRLRPWWGTAPWSLTVRGLVGAAVFGALAYACLEVRSGGIDLVEAGLEEQQSTIELAAAIGLGVAAVGILYGLVRVVVGIVDLAPRRQVEGVVLRADRRRTGDFLPEPLQWFIYRRRRRGQVGQTREHRRRTRLELVLETPDGVRSWNVRSRIFSTVRPGMRVRLASSPLLGYVSAVEPLEPGDGGAPASS